MSELIWRFRYAHRLWSRGGLRFGIGWSASDDAYRDVGTENPVDAADEEMTYWGEY